MSSRLGLLSGLFLTTVSAVALLNSSAEAMRFGHGGARTGMSSRGFGSMHRAPMHAGMFRSMHKGAVERGGSMASRRLDARRHVAALERPGHRNTVARPPGLTETRGPNLEGNGHAPLKRAHERLANAGWRPMFNPPDGPKLPPNMFGYDGTILTPTGPGRTTPPEQDSKSGSDSTQGEGWKPVFNPPDWPQLPPNMFGYDGTLLTPAVPTRDEPRNEAEPPQDQGKAPLPEEKKVANACDPAPAQPSGHTREKPGTGNPNAEQAKVTIDPNGEPTTFSDEQERQHRKVLIETVPDDVERVRRPPYSIFPAPPPSTPSNGKGPTMSKDLRELYEKRAQLLQMAADEIKSRKDSIFPGWLNLGSYDALEHIRSMIADVEYRIHLYETRGADAVNRYDDGEKRKFIIGIGGQILNTGVGTAGGQAVGTIVRAVNTATTPTGAGKAPIRVNTTSNEPSAKSPEVGTTRTTSESGSPGTVLQVGGGKPGTTSTSTTTGPNNSNTAVTSGPKSGTAPSNAPVGRGELVGVGTAKPTEASTAIGGSKGGNGVSGGGVSSSQGGGYGGKGSGVTSAGGASEPPGGKPVTSTAAELTGNEPVTQTQHQPPAKTLTPGQILARGTNSQGNAYVKFRVGDPIPREHTENILRTRPNKDRGHAVAPGLGADDPHGIGYETPDQNKRGDAMIENAIRDVRAVRAPGTNVVVVQEVQRDGRMNVTAKHYEVFWEDQSGNTTRIFEAGYDMNAKTPPYFRYVTPVQPQYMPHLPQATGGTTGAAPATQTQSLGGPAR